MQSSPAASVRPPPYLLRTHVPNADDTSTEQTLAPRAGAGCCGNGTGVRDTGRGNPRLRGRQATGSPAGPDAPRPAERPHRRAPAPPTDQSSAPRASARRCRPTRAGLPHAGTSPGDQAALTARRRPVWEDGSAGRPGASPGRRTSPPLGPPLAGRPESLGRPEWLGADSVAKGARHDNEPPRGGSSDQETGGDLLSQALASQVPSALWGLTALFGMGRGVSPTR